MRLSEAILLGSTMLRPMAFTQNDGKGSGCALGMAAIAGLGDSAWGKDTYDGWASSAPAVAPCGHKEYLQKFCDDSDGHLQPIKTVTSVIAHIFNEHVMGDGSWTLEQLVDWVRSVEPVEQVTMAAPPEATHEPAAEVSV
jgi:hypothetical protein